MSKPFHTLFFIGRMQPLHNGHLHVIKEAAKQAQRVVVLIGSANCARSPKNPFTFEERKYVNSMACIAEGIIPGKDVFFEPLDDYPYNDSGWLANAQRVMSPYINDITETGLVGFNKDKSSYYLKMFPDLASVTIEPAQGLVDATNIREAYFQKLPVIHYDYLPKASSDFLKQFWHQPAFRWILDEKKFYDGYDPRQFDIIISCVDNIVVQSGHILLINRKNIPGKGLLALPGGHVKPDQTFVEAACAELKEETDIRDQFGEIPEGVLKNFIVDKELFDNPDRSLRGRVITMAYCFKLPEKPTLFKVRGMDDAAKASWVKIGSIDPATMFEDHYHIMQTMLARLNK